MRNGSQPKRGNPLKTLHTNSRKPDSARDQVDLRGKIAAIDKSQAVIEFDLDGTILTANENFLKAMGYAARGDQGQHQHVRRGYRHGSDYRSSGPSWAAVNTRLRYRRVGKG